MSVAVLVPWRETPERAPVWAYLRAKWQAAFPAWAVVEGSCPEGPWRKGLAVADALNRSVSDVVIVADADVWTDGIAEAVERVRAGAAWAMPHFMVYRFDQPSTAAILDGAPMGRIINDKPATYDRTHPGRRGGGMVVLSRALYERVPIDPRFAGWGQEDDAWAVALRAVAGKEWRGTEDLWHLWHEPQPRKDAFRGRGSDEGVALLKEYQHAAKARQIDAVLAGAR